MKMENEEFESIRQELLECLKDGGYDGITLEPIEGYITKLQTTLRKENEKWDARFHIERTKRENAEKEIKELKEVVRLLANREAVSELRLKQALKE